MITAKLWLAYSTRWMAPETLGFNLSTIESDRWSFAVLLWEIFTLCARPYAGVTNSEILEHVNQGHRLHQPDACPADVYELMQGCWAADPKRRPAFAQISRVLATASGVVVAVDELLQPSPTNHAGGGGGGGDWQCSGCGKLALAGASFCSQCGAARA